MMTISTIDEWLFLLVGGLVCGLTSYIVSDYSNPRVKPRKHFEYSCLSAIGCMAICYYAAKFFPEKFSMVDAPALSVFIGLFGIGRVLRFISNRFGYNDDNSEGKGL